MRRGGIAFSPAQDGVLDSISVYGRAGADPIKVRMALYDDSDDSFVGGTVETEEFGQTYDWHTAAADGIINVYAAKTYQIVFEQNGNHYVKYDDSGGPNDAYDFETYGNSWPDPASWIDDGQRKFSIYATYTPSGQIKNMACSISAVGGAVASAKRSRQIASEVSGSGAISASSKVQRNIASVIAAAGGLSAAVKRIRGIRTMIAASSDLSAALKASKTFAVNISAVGDLSAAAAAEKKLAGQIAAAGVLSARLVTPGDKPMAVNIAAKGNLSGKLKGIKPTIRTRIMGKTGGGYSTGKSVARPRIVS